MPQRNTDHILTTGRSDAFAMRLLINWYIGRRWHDTGKTRTEDMMLFEIKEGEECLAPPTPVRVVLRRTKSL